MVTVKKGKNFGVFYDGSKSTSGQRFFTLLANNLKKIGKPYSSSLSVILFNVSTPLSKILKAKLRRQKVVLRLDALYFDRLSVEFLASFPLPLRLFFRFGIMFPATHDFFAFWANLLNQNYGGFIRIILADHLIYQSVFSRMVHSRFFKRKPYSVIVNGAEYLARDKSGNGLRNSKKIKTVTIYDEWRPSKRIHELVRFVKWANEEALVPIELTIIGYNSQTSVCFNTLDVLTLENAPYIRRIPKFNTFTEEMQQVLFESDAYLTFSFRDACPNTVIESMAFGLPVIAMASGGLPDIVGDAGVLIPGNDFENGFYCAHRYECDFPKIIYSEVLNSIKEVIENHGHYRSLVSKRFDEVLSIERVTQKYTAVLELLAEH
jgi:glycosyltransferase involved in cell wall biosynthesis